MSSGGKREGSGRKRVEPRIKKVPLPVKIAQWRIDFLDSRKELTGKSRAVLIEEAIDAHYRLDPPK